MTDSPNEEEVSKTKLCSTCRQRYNVAEFYKNPSPSYKDGLLPKCKMCVLEYDRKRAFNRQIKSEGTKRCSDCKYIKDVSEFYKRPRSADGLRSQCKNCSKKQGYKYESANQEKDYFNSLYLKYKLDRSKYEELLLSQNSRCAVCQIEGVRLCVDHNHETGEVRGLLCNHCNLGLGLFRDNIPFLENAIKYLKDHSNVEIR